jgi:hypothetical protein
VKGHHQLIYSTHSPFMVDSRRFDRVRIVQDLGIESDEPLEAEAGGTRVLADLAQASPDSGQGKAQRCEAAQNGQHRGFSCEAVTDDSAGACPRGYNLVLAATQQPVDVNGNGWVCRLA